MTSNAARALVLLRALQAAAAGDRDTVRALCTDDLTAWASTVAASSLDELLAALDRRDQAFSDLELDARPLDVGGAAACAEWTLSMTHTGPIDTGNGPLDPTGRRVTLHGITVAEFHGARICSVRQYWDELEVLPQLLAPAAPPP